MGQIICYSQPNWVESGSNDATAQIIGENVQK